MSIEPSKAFETSSRKWLFSSLSPRFPPPPNANTYMSYIQIAQHICIQYKIIFHCWHGIIAPVAMLWCTRISMEQTWHVHIVTVFIWHWTWHAHIFTVCTLFHRLLSNTSTRKNCRGLVSIATFPHPPRTCICTRACLQNWLSRISHTYKCTEPSISQH